MAQYSWFSGTSSTSNLVFFSDEPAAVYSSGTSDVSSMHSVPVL